MSKGRRAASGWEFRSIVHSPLSMSASFLENRIPNEVRLTLRFTALEMVALRKRKRAREGGGAAIVS